MVGNQLVTSARVQTILGKSWGVFWTTVSGGSAAWFPEDRAAVRPESWSWGSEAQPDRSVPSKEQPPPFRPKSALAVCAFAPWTVRNHPNRSAWCP
jgi:hypothetical protein